jgi:hypothetical protein
MLNTLIHTYLDYVSLPKKFTFMPMCKMHQLSYQGTIKLLRKLKYALPNTGSFGKQRVAMSREG